jgi:subtilisin family serine protease
MYAYGERPASALEKKTSKPSDELRVAITFHRPDGGPGLTKFDAPLSPNSVQHFVPNPVDMDRGIFGLSKMGFVLTRRGRLTASMRISRMLYERVCGTQLTVHRLDQKQGYPTPESFYFPAQGAPWKPEAGFAELIDDAYIQWPHIYMTPKKKKKKRNQAAGGGPSVTPPKVDYFHLEMPKDVPRLLNATDVHKAGVTGKGVRVVMVDTGFAHGSHPFFAANGFTSTVDLAPHAINDNTDPNGHGTGESTNVFSVAPEATFIGVKVENDNDPQRGASMLEGFQAALQHQPNVISISIGFDLRDDSGRQMTELPNSLAALEAEIQEAIASGIVVVFSAGNGHFSFPGMMPNVISAGGVFEDKAGNMEASDYASAFDSKIYSGRHVPDFCGLVGMQPHASYIMLPIPAGCEIDREVSAPDDGGGDGTAVDDGWGVFSGTSAAAPQLAGVCALLLEKNPGLKPADIKAVLRRTARNVSVGHANASSSDDNVGMAANTGDNGACGAGLVDAFAAFQQV